MDLSNFFFWMFAAVLVFSAFRVITARNPVHAVLFLMLAFSQASGIWLLLRAEFLALTLVLVYLGAVTVLFLFVVMMLDIRIDGVPEGIGKQGPIAAIIGVLVVAQLGLVLMRGYGAVDTPVAVMDGQDIGNTKALGILLYTKYLYPIQVAGAILLVGMIAAIALTLRKRKDSKAIDPAIAVRVKSKDRLELVKMDATRKAAPAAEATEENKA